MSGPRPSLASTERLLLYAMRAWAAARAAGLRPPAVVAPTFAANTSPRAAAFFAAWMQALDAGARRPIGWAVPCGGAPSADERRLIQACGLAPVDLQLSCRMLAPLLGEPESAAVLGRGLSLALSAAGWPCPARLAPPPAGRTLH